MALFFECVLQCAQKVLDAADIVRDGDISTATTFLRRCKLLFMPLSVVIDGEWILICKSSLSGVVEIPIGCMRAGDSLQGESHRPLSVSPSSLEIGAPECRD